MDLTVQIITRNNLDTITKTIESIKPLNADILIADLGNDGTFETCRHFGCRVFRFDEKTGYDEIRNILIDRSNTEWQLYLYPWEYLIQGHSNFNFGENNAKNVTVIQNSIITNEIRIWKKSNLYKFVNPVYEFIEGNGEPSDIVVYSTGGWDYNYNLDMIKLWKKSKPTSHQPHYYNAITLLALKQYDFFINASEYYMFMDKKVSKSSIMNKYYYALVQLIFKKNAKSSLQNINICIAHQPLMAEFWCLAADVYYHLLNKFTTAKELYKNALILGSRRLNNDGWPMDVLKYDEYPNLMIKSCDDIIKKSIYLNHIA